VGFDVKSLGTMVAEIPKVPGQEHEQQIGQGLGNKSAIKKRMAWSPGACHMRGPSQARYRAPRKRVSKDRF
jgi:hypothetical protein